MKAFSHFLSSFSSNPIFSCIVSLYALILIYLPHLFLRIIFSPVLNATGILFFALLRLGAIQRLEDEITDNSCQFQTSRDAGENAESKENGESGSVEPVKTEFPEEDIGVASQSETDSESDSGINLIPCFEDSFVEWDVKAPLEVIYEEYEGDEAEEDPNPSEKYPNPNEGEGIKNVSHERHPSLSMYYPESDSDDSSEGDGDFRNFPPIGEWYSPESGCLTWNEEDREGLIEIALDGNKRGRDFHVEEENLIEIDISPMRNEEFPGKKLKFPGEKLTKTDEPNGHVIGNIKPR
ncbi:uncharacterized protein LOC122275181 isoform X1 [Carya illinoinensis]|uniref:Uncharacterized protein n=1 Tax=Carya illinoinensis TaxID=32201 RepID=A0A8T1PMD1_CARIL|nr:uncharacterized protein LOC122275181 isoform X1 [Carya illinoinensis]KAG6620947.1 hypothetical protein I3842_Q049500 [Carya illinoinensis]KAG6642691.1 hypothetical protein CIPAW_09G157800 [Carya illinoinensis]